MDEIITQAVSNPRREKWPTPELRREMCQKLCEHLAAGHSLHSWPYAGRTQIYRYIKDYPEDFCPEMIDAAHRTGIAMLEAMGLHGASGQIKGFNPLAWKFIMQNKAGWAEKQETKNEHTFIPIQINLPPENAD